MVPLILGCDLALKAHLNGINTGRIATEMNCRDWNRGWFVRVYGISAVSICLHLGLCSIRPEAETPSRAIVAVIFSNEYRLERWRAPS